MNNIGKNVVMNAVSVGKAGTSYSDAANFVRSVGFAGVLVVSSAGSITVTQQCSLDGITWYDAKDKNNVAVGAVVAAMTVGSRYVQFDPVIAPYMRFKVVEGNVAASVVSLTLVSQETF